MRYLRKSEQSEIIKRGWRYSIQSQRPKIRIALLREQKQFCAYTERYIAPIDACDIEHFDDRLKDTPKDDYWNWYAVHHWINIRKRPIVNFLPIMSPYDETLPNRIRYVDGEFRAVDEDDIEAIHLIEFLGWNDPELAEYRARTINRIKEFRTFYNGDDAKFVEFITAHPEYLDFISALEVELGLSLG